MEELRAMLDDEWVKSLHVQAMSRAEAHRDRPPHVLFQASTVAALLDGAFEGDLSFAELAEHATSASAPSTASTAR